MIRLFSASALAGAALLGACASADETPVTETRAQRGQIIAATECATCHSIGPSGASPLEGAPPLRTVLASYNTATLEMDLMDGMRVGHADMPRFTFDPRTVDALIVYLQSIQQ